ncbi:hypothetical protein HRbin09_01781 [bacterium HR09]|nr:hypothetical protein HRbin09_01781 [bacterium HR09]
MGKSAAAARKAAQPEAQLRVLRRRFFRRLLYAFCASALAWLLLKGPYGAAVSWVAQGLTRMVSFSTAPVLEAQGNHVVIGRRDFRADSGWLQLSLVQVHANAVPFFALGFALATSRRARLAVLRASLWLAAAHVLFLVAEAQWFYASQLGAWSLANYSDFSRAFWGVLRFFLNLAVPYALPIVLVFWAVPAETAELLGFSRLDERMAES